ncbi:MAG TPA: STAS domain-containing protein [Chthoniobacterales bacterium]|jgi:anti-sigma B factor antagonist|nr:STAS domain-containing protein [Chthoniobacterales bacterium]
MALLDWDNFLPLEGEIDLHRSPRVERSLASMIKRKPNHLVVDLSGVTFIDSSGVAVLIRALQNVRQYGGKLTLSGMNDKVRPIFEITRLDQVFVIDPGDSLSLGD